MHGGAGGKKPDVIAYACTAGSMVQPLDSLAGFIEKTSGIKGVATAPALVHACRAMGLKRVSLATPYHDALNQHEKHFLAENGIEVVSVKGLGIGAGGAQEYVRIAKVAPEDVYAHCRVGGREGGRWHGRQLHRLSHAGDPAGSRPSSASR